MPYLFQYQARSDPLQPISAPAETITADKWQGERPDLNPRRPFAVALLVAGMFAPVAVPPAATVDQWGPRQPERVTVAAPRQPGLCVVDPVMVPVTPAAWLGSATLPVRPPAPRQSGLVVIDPVLVPVAIDAWAAVWTQPQRVIPRQAGAFTVEPSPLRTVTAADWLGFDDYRPPTPRPDLRQWYAGPTTLVASTEVITLDKWLWTWPQPDRHVAPRQTAGYAGPTQVIPTPVPSLAAWYAAQPQPLPRPKLAYPTGGDVVAVTPGVDAWQGVQPQPLPRKPFIYPTGGTVIVPTPTVDGWQGIQPVAVGRRVRQPDGGSVAPVLVPVVAVDNGPLDWLAPTSQPLIRAGRPQQPAGGQFVIYPVLPAPVTPASAGDVAFLVGSDSVLILQLLA